MTKLKELKTITCSECNNQAWFVCSRQDDKRLVIVCTNCQLSFMVDFEQIVVLKDKVKVETNEFKKPDRSILQNKEDKETNI